MMTACLLLAAICAASASVHPTRLRCEYSTDPIGIGEPKPALSWIDEAADRGAAQSAYRIVASGELDNVKQGHGDLWDTGKVSSSDSIHVEYNGPALSSRQRVYWAVQVWDGKGEESAFSAPAFFETGLMSAADWKGQWISLPGAEGHRENLAGAMWMWFPEGDPAKSVPDGATRYFRYDFDVPKASDVSEAILELAVDDAYTISVNGVSLGEGSSTRHFDVVDFKKALHDGRNVVCIVGRNGQGAASAFVAGHLTMADGSTKSILSGTSWRVSQSSASGWDSSGFDDSTWVDAAAIAKLGDRPWGEINQAPPPGPAAMARKEFTVEKKVTRARIYGTALGLYQVEIDGKRVGNDIFTPGWTDYHKRVQYQTYDVTDRLKPGPHAIGVMLGDGWYCGHVGWSGRCLYGPKAFGMLQLEIDYDDGSRDTIATDSSWKIGTGPIRTSDIMMGEEYDARQERAGWSSPKFDDSKWVAAEAQPLTEMPIVGQPCDSARKVMELPAKSMKQVKPGVFVADLGQNMVGWARLKVQAPAGTQIGLRFAEMLEKDGSVYTANLRGAKATDYYTCKGGGVEIYEPHFTFHGFRYIELTGFPGTPPKDAVTGVVVTSVTEQTGTFECSNALVNQLQHNIQWGQRGNYLEVPTDCPQRDERLGWMGDAQIFVRTACFNFDVAAFMSKWEQDVIDAQSAEGGFSDVSPRVVDTSDGAPAWADAGVIVPWTIYLSYGDKRVLERSYEAMTKWIAYVDSANPDHLWKNRRNNDFGDWLNIAADMPREVLGTSYFAYSTSIVRDAAIVLGKTEDAEKYDRLFNEIRDAYARAYVDADGKIEGDTQTCYVLALRFGLMPTDRIGKAIQRLADNIVQRDTHLSTGFVGVGYLLPTLTRVGKLDLAYKLLENDTFPSWGYSIRQGATTIWERWDGYRADKGFQDPGMNSFNHYSLGSVGEWLYETVGGIDIDPAKPGYEHIVIRPRPGGGLTWAKAAYDSVRGRIETSWKISGETFDLDVTIPANTTATIWLPAGLGASVSEGGTEAGKSPGVKEIGFNEGPMYEVGGGHYRFHVVGQRAPR